MHSFQKQECTPEVDYVYLRGAKFIIAINSGHCNLIYGSCICIWFEYMPSEIMSILDCASFNKNWKRTSSQIIVLFIEQSIFVL
jgi:hypothetical protein